eukprot:COSAG04_NODE_279_length_18210_cov_5.657225_6_plen_271_part_00
MFGVIGCSSSTGQYFGWQTAPPGGPLFEKKPGACSELMFTRRLTPNMTQASTTLKVALMLFVKTVCGALCSMSGMAAMWTTASGWKRPTTAAGTQLHSAAGAQRTATADSGQRLTLVSYWRTPRRRRSGRPAGSSTGPRCPACPATARRVSQRQRQTERGRMAAGARRRLAPHPSRRPPTACRSCRRGRPARRARRPCRGRPSRARAGNPDCARPGSGAPPRPSAPASAEAPLVTSEANVARASTCGVAARRCKLMSFGRAGAPGGDGGC